MLVDESSAVKPGENSVGVAAQYCGSVGKSANGQVGLYLGYASRKGYSLLEGHKEKIPIWCTPPKVHVPKWKGHGPHPTRLRLKDSKKHPMQVQQLVKKTPSQDWVRAMIKEGSQGPIVWEFAFLRVRESRYNLPGPQLWLIIRRNLADPTEIKYYFSNAPADTPLQEFVRLSGMRWPIEIIFEEGKGEIGLDHCEMRSWIGWHHHRLLVSLAHHFQVRLKIQCQDRALPITFYQVHLLLSSVLPTLLFDLQAIVERVCYYQKRNFITYRSHRKTRLAQLRPFSLHFAL